MAVTSTGFHAHGCVMCRSRYEDTCATPNENARCRPCDDRGAGWALLIANRMPRDCCFLHSRPATKEELKLYRLSTACSWFKCSVCARTQPFRTPIKENFRDR